MESLLRKAQAPADALVGCAEPSIAAPLASHVTPSCCVGVDLPGVGHVHASDCPHHGETSAAADAFHVAAPDCARIASMEALESNAARLLAHLLFAAKDLAETQILRPASLRSTICVQCSATARAGEALAHEPHCPVGRVLAILRGLAANRLEFDPDRKEAAEPEPGAAKSESPSPRAGERIAAEGIETPDDGAVALRCDACGAVGGEGWSLLSMRSYCNRPLDLNECERRVLGCGYLYTHNCPKGGAR